MENPFVVLHEQQLSSVIFVQDYLQLDFDGNKISFYKWPAVIVKDQQFQINDTDYRNRLCTFITKIVIETKFFESQLLSILFDSEDRIEIRLEDADREIIYFTTSEGEWSSI